MRRAVLVFLFAVLSGCGAQQSVEPLEPAVRLYGDGIRWQRFDDAASRLPPERRDDFLDQRDRLHDDLRVHDYEIIRVRFGPEGRRARVHVKYSWYLESRGVVHETHAIQRWHRPAEVWLMVGEEHLRGEPMPGIEDPEQKPDAPAPEGTEPSPETLPDTAPDAADDVAGAGIEDDLRAP